jgi:2-C-methyl-D-erythritol 4-phosphate cytidylyltransferase
MNRFVIIVAGGKGLRMNAEMPKQFLAINGKPILMYTIEAFARFDANMKILVVLPQEHITTWRTLCEQFQFDVPHQMVLGGDTRFKSVLHGLLMIQSEGAIAVHDGVRPIVSPSLIGRCFETAEKLGSAIPVCNMVESVRQRIGNNTKNVDRNEFVMVQTPQVFNSIMLKMAYKQAQPKNYTDDASLVELLGIALNMVEGERSNIKITEPLDLKLAEWLLASH